MPFGDRVFQTSLLVSILSSCNKMTWQDVLTMVVYKVNGVGKDIYPLLVFNCTFLYLMNSSRPTIKWNDESPLLAKFTLPFS